MHPDRANRVVSDMNSMYLSAEALSDIERLGIDLVVGAPIIVCDYDGTNTEPTWLVVKCILGFDHDRRMWQIGYSMDDCHWEPRVN